MRDDLRAELETLVHAWSKKPHTHDDDSCLHCAADELSHILDSLPVAKPTHVARPPHPLTMAGK